LPPGDSPVCRVLVHPANPAPVTAAPTSSKNPRRSIDTPRTVPTRGRSRRSSGPP